MTFDLVLNKDIPKYESSNGMRTAQLLSVKQAAARCGGADTRHLVPINIPFDDSYFRNVHSITWHATSVACWPRHATPIVSLVDQPRLACSPPGMEFAYIDLDSWTLIGWDLHTLT